jgi:nucleotide-binding universal stress UspA family protein
MLEVRNILVPVDFTPISERNLRMGVEMCKRIGARLVLHHNMDTRPPGFLSVNWMWSEDKESGEAKKAAEVPDRMEALFAKIPEGIRFEARMTRGPLETSLLHVAKELPADLIVMGSHGRSSAEHESLTERIIIQAPCSVFTIGEDYSPEAVFDVEHTRTLEEQTFLVPVDFSPRARAVMDFAFAVGAVMPHKLDLLHVMKEGSGAGDSDQRDREVEAVRERLKNLVPEAIAGKVEVHVRIGDPTTAILGAARELDPLCIVMAAHGKSALRRFLFGGETMKILHGARCPVWFVPAAAQKGLTATEFIELH